MTVTPQIYLAFDGRCEAALRFYEQHLGGRIVGLFTWGGSPMAGDAPPEWADKVMHATLALGNSVIAAADVAPGNYERPQGFSVLLGVGGVAEAERVFHALAEHGTVTVPMMGLLGTSASLMPNCSGFAMMFLTAWSLGR